jgi:hypothetical protein
VAICTRLELSKDDTLQYVKLILMVSISKYRQFEYELANIIGKHGLLEIIFIQVVEFMMNESRINDHFCGPQCHLV